MAEEAVHDNLQSGISDDTPLDHQGDNLQAGTSDCGDGFRITSASPPPPPAPSASNIDDDVSEVQVHLR